jgi:hypothetical protein
VSVYFHEAQKAKVPTENDPQLKIPPGVSMINLHYFFMLSLSEISE